MVRYIALGAGSCGFVSRVSQIDHRLANGSPLLRRFFEAVLPNGPLSYQDGPRHSFNTSAQYREYNEDLMFADTTVIFSGRKLLRVCTIYYLELDGLSIMVIWS